MKKTLTSLLFVSGLWFLNLFFYNGSVFAQQLAVPFRVEVEQVSQLNAPTLQSYVYAQQNGKWLLMAGRTNGLHNFPSPVNNSAFPTVFANKMMYVYDPVTDTRWSKNIYTDLPLGVADQLRATNLQYLVLGNMLYVVGGYGKDSALSSPGRDSMVTFPRLTAINISGAINAVINGTSIAPFVRSIIDTNMAVTGGKLRRLDNTFLLCVGQKFTGLYGFSGSGVQNGVQKYTDEIRTFNIVDDGVNLSIANLSHITNPAILHRRDLNVVDVINNTTRLPELRLYGGVFTNDVSTWNNPVNVSLTSATQDNSFSQRFSHYDCANLGVYDSVYNRMSTVLFGGISLWTLDTLTNTPYIDTAGCGGPCIPFINLISVITKYSNNSYKDSLLPIRFPQNKTLGSEMNFIIDTALPTYNNRVIKVNQLSNRTFVGYLYGGIDASATTSENSFMHQMYDKSKRGRGAGSTATSIIYKVYLTPNVVSVQNISSIVPQKYSLHQNYPNPFNPVTKIGFQIPKSGVVKISIYDITGKKISSLVNEQLNAGSYETIWNGDKFSSGVYYYTIEVNDFVETRKMLLVK
ncbi:MAG TPA: T9SS type A sorting domain-containing protein [Ignavibacteria bacterium]|nr:T9SS type A sorting domain-containing protein [Ignavibacteria bacterium]